MMVAVRLFIRVFSDSDIVLALTMANVTRVLAQVLAVKLTMLGEFSGPWASDRKTVFETVSVLLNIIVFSICGSC